MVPFDSSRELENLQCFVDPAKKWHPIVGGFPATPTVQGDWGCRHHQTNRAAAALKQWGHYGALAAPFDINDAAMAANGPPFPIKRAACLGGIHYALSGGI